MMVAMVKKHLACLKGDRVTMCLCLLEDMSRYLPLDKYAGFEAESGVVTKNRNTWHEVPTVLLLPC